MPFVSTARHAAPTSPSLLRSLWAPAALVALIGAALRVGVLAAVAAVLGCALGVFYGWAGAQLVLADLSATAGAGTAVRPVVPWRELGLVVAVAALAGLAASLLPARRAARLSPVAGLAAV